MLSSVVRVCLPALVAVTLAIPAAAEPTFRTIHRFHGGIHDGARPVGPLVADKNGVLYGVTYKGGASDWGTVFSLTPPTPPNTAWKKTILHDFHCSLSDGCGPMAGLTLHGGRLYGAAFYGGTQGDGVVFRLSPMQAGTWNYKVLYNFDDPPDAIDPITKVAFGRDGALYGFTFNGGPNAGGALYKLTPAQKPPWSETVLYRFSGFGDIPVGGNTGDPIVHQNGAVISTTGRGGPTTAGTVFQFGPTDTEPTILHSFDGYDGMTPLHGVISDATGTLFGTTAEGGAHNAGTVFRLTPPLPPDTAWTFTKLHDFPAVSGNFSGASALVRNAQGRLFGSLANGGAQNAGYVYRLSPPADGQGRWTRWVLHTFRGGSDGEHPGTLLRGPRGVLYGTTSAGGTTCNCGTVFMIDP